MPVTAPYATSCQGCCPPPNFMLELHPGARSLCSSTPDSFSPLICRIQVRRHPAGQASVVSAADTSDLIAAPLTSAEPLSPSSLPLTHRGGFTFPDLILTKYWGHGERQACFMWSLSLFVVVLFCFVFFGWVYKFCVFGVFVFLPHCV